MKITIIRSLIVVMVSWLVIPTVQAGDGALETLKERFSYALGLQIGNDIEKMKENLDAEAFMRGIKDHLGDKKPQLTPGEVIQVKEAFQKRMQEEIQKKNQVIASENRTAGEAFLANNKKRKEVVTTASGLQYEVLTPGHGSKPEATSTVKVHYRGTFLDGTEFDSSYKRKKPVSFPLDRVIAGWTEGLQRMPVGAKYRFFIPSDLAYGKRGAPPKIGGNATLTFDVELLEIVKEKAKQGSD